MSNFTGFFLSTMSKILEELEAVCIMWIDDLIIWGSSQGELVSNLAEVLDGLHGVGWFVAVRKCIFFEPTVKSCGKIYSD